MVVGGLLKAAFEKAFFREKKEVFQAHFSHVFSIETTGAFAIAIKHRNTETIVAIAIATTMPSTIRIGDLVSSAVGAKGTIPEGKKRKSRHVLYGFVIASVPGKKWIVYWMQYQKCSAHTSNKLKKPDHLQNLRGQYELLDIPKLLENDVVDDIRAYIDKGGKVVPWHQLDHTSPTPRSASNGSPERSGQPPQPNLPRPATNRIGASPTVVTNPSVAAPRNSAADSVAMPPPASVATTVATTDPSIGTDSFRADMSLTTTDPSTESTTETPATTDESGSSDDDDAATDQACYDPASVAAELMDACRHQLAFDRYKTEKGRLIGSSVVQESDHRGPGKARKSYLKWTVREDVKADDIAPGKKEFEQVGVTGIDWQKHDDIRCGPKNKNKRKNFLELLIHLWPGDWREQLKQLNVRIRKENKDKERNGRLRARAKLMKEISEREFWIFFGLMIVARTFGRDGEIWDSTTRHEGEVPICDYTKDMTRARFKAIRSVMPWLFADMDKEGTDPWFQITKGIEGFNRNRMEKVWASFTKVVDESISAFRPRTTKHGNLPHLSWVLRKPEPLGTEFKVVADSETGMLLHLELMRGKHKGMEDLKYAKQYKATCATVVRLQEATARTTNVDRKGDTHAIPKETLMGDSWFTSVQAAIQVALRGGNYIGVLKTAYNGYPKKFIQDKMKNWPGGSHLVLETTTPEEVELLAIGYKYNKNKILCFLATKGAGHTEPGSPYKARWKDDNGNTNSRDVNRPEIVSKYFERSNKIDVHNQSRQHDLRLEKHWTTCDGNFRVVTTLFGMTVTDAWLAYKHHLDPKHRHKNIKVAIFAAIVCKDCLENKFRDTPPEEHLTMYVPGADASTISALTSPDGSRAPSPSDGAAAGSSAAVGAPARTSYEDIVEELKRKHVLVKCEERTSYSNVVDGKKRCGVRTKRGHCRDCGRKTPTHCGLCEPVYGAKEAWLCSACHPKHLKELESAFYTSLSNRVIG